MNVAVTAVTLFPGTRARSIAALVRTIRVACEHHPAPDLIVLPDCHHCASEVIGVPRWSPAMCTGLIETIAWQAREWGVWIAVGHALARSGRLVNGATLFDPDGDRYLQFPVPHYPGAADRDGKASGENIAEDNGTSDVDGAWAVRATPLGICALSTGRALPTRPVITPSAGLLDLAIISAAMHETACDDAWLRALARNSRCHVCLGTAIPAGQGVDGEVAGTALIIDRNGELCATASKLAGVAHASLDIAPLDRRQLMEALDPVE